MLYYTVVFVNKINLSQMNLYNLSHPNKAALFEGSIF